MAVCHTSKNLSAGGASRARPKDTISNFNASFQQLQHAVPQLLLCIVLIACEPLIPLAAGPLLPHLLLLLLLLLLLHPRLKLPQLLQVLGAFEQALQVAVQPRARVQLVLAQLALVLHPLALPFCIILRLWHCDIIPLKTLFFGHV
eukprot:1141971-Pelagomonas_calceolata.AAC.1